MPSISERSPFEIIVNLGCVYKSPVDRSGNYLGPPLIAYNRTYFDIDGKQKNYVGFCYYNTDLIKQSSEATKYFSNILAEKIKANLPLHRHIITAQQEDFILTSTIADKLSYSKSFFEKKVLAAPDPQNGRKEDAILVYGDKNIQVHRNYIIFEGVYNNSDTTQKMIDLIKSAGGKVAAIACIINISKKKPFRGIPILSVIRIPTPQYQQNNPYVQKLMENNNITWDPERYWDFLKNEMQKWKR